MRLIIIIMINNYLSIMPEEIESMIWKVYFQENVLSEINHIIPAKNGKNQVNNYVHCVMMLVVSARNRC